MEAAAARLWGDGLEGRTVCVLGAGKVGGEIIRLLVQQQVVVIASDVDPAKAERALAAGAARLVDPADALKVDADILCPCALGGLLTEGVVPELSFGLIVGAANNQLAQGEVADSLAAAGILYVPDFLANAGGIINIAEESRGYDQARALHAVGRIGATTTAVLERAASCAITPLAAAEEVVAQRLARASGAPVGPIEQRARMCPMIGLPLPLVSGFGGDVGRPERPARRALRLSRSPQPHAPHHREG